MSTEEQHLGHHVVFWTAVPSDDYSPWTEAQDIARDEKAQKSAAIAASTSFLERGPAGNLPAQHRSQSHATHNDTRVQIRHPLGTSFLSLGTRVGLLAREPAPEEEFICEQVEASFPNVISLANDATQGGLFDQDGTSITQKDPRLVVQLTHGWTRGRSAFFLDPKALNALALHQVKAKKKPKAGAEDEEEDSSKEHDEDAAAEEEAQERRAIAEEDHLEREDILKLTREHLVKIEDPHKGSFLFDWQATRPTPLDEAHSSGVEVINLDSLLGQVGGKLDEFEEEDEAAQKKFDERTKVSINISPFRRTSVKFRVGVYQLPPPSFFTIVHDGVS